VELNVQIRRAILADAPDIAAVLLSAFAEYESLYTPAAFAATTPTANQILVRMAEGPIWVALQDNALMGTLAAVLKHEALYLRGMGIVPVARGARIGDKLLAQAEEFAAQHSCERMFLSTTPFLTRAIRLYEQFGFRRNAEGPHDLFGTPLFTMSKSLHQGNASEGI
jgi:ribosomal protein S18 acetylase RimI-like enzyme